MFYFTSLLDTTYYIIFASQFADLQQYTVLRFRGEKKGGLPLYICIHMSHTYVYVYIYIYIKILTFVLNKHGGDEGKGQEDRTIFEKAIKILS